MAAAPFVSKGACVDGRDRADVEMGDTGPKEGEMGLMIGLARVVSCGHREAGTRETRHQRA